MMFEEPIDILCEVIFQKNKKEVAISWTRSTLPGLDSRRIEMSRGYLIQKGVLIQSRMPTNNLLRTTVNPEVLKAESFKEAIEILKDPEKYYDRLLDSLPHANPAAKNKNRVVASLQKAGLWIISHMWQLIIAIAATMIAAYLLVKWGIPH